MKRIVPVDTDQDYCDYCTVCRRAIRREDVLSGKCSAHQDYLSEVTRNQVTLAFCTAQPFRLGSLDGLAALGPAQVHAKVVSSTITRRVSYITL